MPARLKAIYESEVVPALRTQFEYKNVMQVPRLEKVVLNIGVGEAVQNSKAIEGAVEDLGIISGQQPSIRKAKRSVSNFKLREGMPIGCHVTLRREVMWEFLDRLNTAALPRIRDFRGISPRSFDGSGNYSLGISDQSIFPEIELDKVKRTQGMDITIVTSAKSNDEALDLLTRLGLPFAKK